MAEISYRIWIAEDNPADVYLVEEALRRHEFAYALRTADNGETMMNMIAELERDPSESSPDVFLIDLNLPRRSGDEILARIRQTNRCAHTPVIVITSSDSPQDRARTRELGGLLLLPETGGPGKIHGHWWNCPGLPGEDPG